MTVVGYLEEGTSDWWAHEMGVTRPSEGTYFHGSPSYPWGVMGYPWVFMTHGYDAIHTPNHRRLHYHSDPKDRQQSSPAQSNSPPSSPSRRTIDGGMESC